LRTEITKLEKRYVELERSLRLAKMTSRDQKIIADIEFMLKDCRMTIDSFLVNKKNVDDFRIAF
jgi:hypothetical protein